MTTHNCWRGQSCPRARRRGGSGLQGPTDEGNAAPGQEWPLQKRRTPACAGVRSVSGTADKPGPVRPRSLSRPRRPFLSPLPLPAGIVRPIRGSDGAGSTSPHSGLAPGGVCRARFLAVPAVGSYPTVSPLPARADPGGRFVFCCTFPIPPRRGTAGFASHHALWSPDFPRPLSRTRSSGSARAA